MKRTIFFTTAILLIFLTGCGQSSPTPINVYTGTEGLTINFLENNPPKETYEDSELVVMAEVWNKGAHDLNGSEDNYAVVNLNFDTLYFTGQNPQLYPLFAPSQTQKLTLQGKSQSWPTGEKNYMQMANLKVNKITGTREMPTTTVEASVCYPYETILSQSICMDGDIYNLETTPVCRNKGAYTFSGQGAPIAITKLEVDMIPAGLAQGQTTSLGEETSSMKLKPSFKITFTNVGKGVVFTSNEYLLTQELCSISNRLYEKDNINTLKIKVYLGNDELTCMTNSEVKLYSNEGSIRCEVPQGKVYQINRNYESLLTIQADYYYRTSTSKTVQINRVY